MNFTCTSCHRTKALITIGCHLGTELTIEDLPVVTAAVSAAKADWKKIGLELGLSSKDLGGVEGSVDYRCLDYVLRAWLSKTELHPTWASLIKALKSKVVGRDDLADEIGKCRLNKVGIAATD